MHTRTDAASPSLPKNFLRPCVLLLLREQPGHGYDLIERLRPLGFDRDDPGRLYRLLRTLEGEGLVRASWEPSVTGPDRRIYELTRSGMEALHDAAQSLLQTNLIIGGFLGRFGEFVALERPLTPAPAAASPQA